jgi:hypothetical protein
MHVYEWQSYACNNSSDHRLVARFKDAKKAAAMAKEIKTVLEKNAKQCEDAANGDADWGDPHDLEPSPALVAFAEKYGGEFTEGLIWGDEDCFTEDVPEVAQLGDAVVLYHDYMSGGFDGDLPGILEKAGATEVACNSGPPWMKFTVQAKAGKAAALQQAVGEIFAQRTTTDNLCDWEVPWAERKGALPIERKLDNLALVATADGVEFTMATGRRGWISNWTEWLTKKAGAAEVSVALASEADIAALRKAELAKVTAADKASAAKGSPAKGQSYKGKTFVITGELAGVTEDEAKARVKKLGGKVEQWVTNKLDVLVIGDEGSALFGKGAKCNKQLTAEGLNDEGAKIEIISESQFLKLK